MDARTHGPVKTQTLVAQGVGVSDPLTKALVSPIHMSATYIRDPDNGYSGGHVYGRTDNPSVQQSEALIAALEGADDAMMFASGMAAASAVFQALDKATHIVASHVMYWGLRAWLKGIGRFGHTITFVETSDLDAVRAAIRPGKTGLLWIETPSNPLWTITDIAAISEIAHAAGALLCVDSTVSTPILTRPITHGADVVIHSATKYLNGHSDVIGGIAIVGDDHEPSDRLKVLQNAVGGIAGPLGGFLVLRGVKALALRMERHCANALMIAEALDRHPSVRRVIYPGLPTHPQHELVRRQMNGFGGM